jgi:hypothetical protein
MKSGIALQILSLWIGAGLLVSCSIGSKTPPPDPVAAWLTGEPRHKALIHLRKYLPKIVTCPSTIELTEEGVTWVDLQTCSPVDLRRRLNFKDLQGVRLVQEKVSMGRDKRWVEVFQIKSWLPIGRGVGHLNNKEGIQALQEVKSALERLSQGRETPHHWKSQARSFLF